MDIEQTFTYLYHVFELPSVQTVDEGSIHYTNRTYSFMFICRGVKSAGGVETFIDFHKVEGW